MVPRKPIEIMVSVPVAPRRFVMFVPELPPSALSPNGGHGNRYEKAEAIRWFRGIIATRAAEAMRRDDCAPFARARVGVVAYVYWNRGGRKPYQVSDRYRPLDVPNLVAALKPLYDGLQDARIIPGDTVHHMALGHHDIVEVRDYAEEGLAVTIEELPPL